MSIALMSFNRVYINILPYLCIPKFRNCLLCILYFCVYTHVTGAIKNQRFLARGPCLPAQSPY